MYVDECIFGGWGYEEELDTDECIFGGWGYEEELDVAVEGGVVFKGCGGAVEEQGEGGEG